MYVIIISLQIFQTNHVKLNGFGDTGKWNDFEIVCRFSCKFGQHWLNEKDIFLKYCGKCENYCMIVKMASVMKNISNEKTRLSEIKLCLQ